METKISILLNYMRAGQWPDALRLANSFSRLGDHKERITRGWAAIQNPDFYRSIGRRPEQLIEDGITALRERYARELSR